MSEQIVINFEINGTHQQMLYKGNQGWTEHRIMENVRRLYDVLGGALLDADNYCVDGVIEPGIYHIVKIRVKETSSLEVSLFLPCQDGFYKGVSSSTEDGDWIAFKYPIPSTRLNRLMVRDSYRSIVSNILPGENKTIITGTPGVGKSLFLFYLLRWLVKMGKRVLFVYHPDIIYYDMAGNVFQLRQVPSVVEHEFWKDDLWCLFDAKQKNESHLNDYPYGRCTFVLSTSPKRDMINDFKKPPEPQIFYMPVWEECELEMLSREYPKAAKWRERFRVLGGIPRHVLESTTGDPKQLLHIACTACDLNDCIKLVGINSIMAEKSQAIHALIHITSVAPFVKSSVRFASKTALDIIVANKAVEAKRILSQLVASCETEPHTAALCGYIFERHAVEMLEIGGEFTCRQLVHGNNRNKPRETLLVIPPSLREVVDRIVPKQTANQLFVPKNKNYTGIDAWIPGIGAFQMTVGKTHDLKRECITDLIKLGEGASKVYWLLPPPHYNSFTKKSPQNVEQYAVLIPYPKIE